MPDEERGVLRREQVGPVQPAAHKQPAAGLQVPPFKQEGGLTVHGPRADTTGPELTQNAPKAPPVWHVCVPVQAGVHVAEGASHAAVDTVKERVVWLVCCAQAVLVAVVSTPAVAPAPAAVT